MYLKLRYTLWYKLGCMGENQHRNYVPQNVVQTKLCTTCTTNVVQNVVQIRVHGVLKISQQSFRMKIRKICRCKNRGGWGLKNKKIPQISQN